MNALARVFRGWRLSRLGRVMSALTEVELHFVKARAEFASERQSATGESIVAGALSASCRAPFLASCVGPRMSVGSHLERLGQRADRALCRVAVGDTQSSFSHGAARGLVG